MFRIFNNNPSKGFTNAKLTALILMAALLVSSCVLNNITKTGAYAKAKDKTDKVKTDKNKKEKNLNK